MTTVDLILVVVQMVLATCLAVSCFCRLVRTDAETIREIRLAIWFEGVAAGLVGGAPILPWLVPEVANWPPGVTPRGIWLVLLVAATSVQIVTARYWKTGVPAVFQKDCS